MVDAAFAHRNCAACRRALDTTGARHCPPLSAAIDALLDWRRGRALATRARETRVRELAQIRADLALEPETVA